MDTLSLQRLLLQMDLMPTEKLIGMVLALHLNKKTGKIRVRQETVAQECGVSVSTARRAIKNLVSAGAFESKRTGRATILAPTTPQASGKNSGIVERSPVNSLIVHPRPIKRRKNMPWDYDTTHSTMAEEKGKREEAQLAPERAGRRG